MPQSTPQQQSGYRLPHQGGTAAGPSSQAAPGASAESRARASFPHAFERWETLSAHWEGLTSFWIRRLEQNAAEIDRDPLAQQLTRQVNDLSAAGANLFHAVVELQRLRASSERKFLRWFVETRNELERNQEMTAMLEAALEEERQSRAEAINAAVEQERSNSKVQKKLEEMRKELAISKEEARRAWEELGRREQEERDRTVSLQSGLPTLVGGVQVVPMAHGVPSRHASGRESRSHAEPSDYGAEYTQAPPVQPATYHQQGPETVGSYGSEAGYSEGEYAIDDQGNFIRDSQGRKVLFRATAAGGGAGPSSSGRLPGTGSAEEAESESGAEEYETPASQGGPPYPPAPAAPPAPTNPAHLHPQWAGTYNPANPEYTGQGFPQPGWESMPRHHHPTRLSDVLEEEEERSRTSASQVSRP